MGCFGLGDALQVWKLRRATSGGLTCPKSGLFVVTQQMGAKSAKKEESESWYGHRSDHMIQRVCERSTTGRAGSAVNELAP